jgi:hypothetical protein
MFTVHPISKVAAREKPSGREVALLGFAALSLLLCCSAIYHNNIDMTPV